jgi:hypothetical protein
VEGTMPLYRDLNPSKLNEFLTIFLSLIKPNDPLTYNLYLKISFKKKENFKVSSGCIMINPAILAINGEFVNS